MRGLRPLCAIVRDLSAVAALESRLIQPCSVLYSLREFTAHLSPAAGDYRSAGPHQIVRDCPWDSSLTTSYTTQLLLARQVHVPPTIDPTNQTNQIRPFQLLACIADKHIWLAAEGGQQRPAAQQSREGAICSPQLGRQATCKTRAVCEADTLACSHRYCITGHFYTPCSSGTQRSAQGHTARGMQHPKPLPNLQQASWDALMWLFRLSHIPHNALGPSPLHMLARGCHRDAAWPNCWG